MGCSMQRQVVSESRDRVATYREADSMKEEKVVAEHDTVMEVTTIHVRTNEAGDTVFRSVVTDRMRAASRDKIAKQTTKTVVRVDTVFVAVRDSMATYRVTGGGGFQDGKTALHTTLKWMVALVVAVIILVLVIRFSFR